MAVIDFSVQRNEPYLGGLKFGQTGAYRRIDGIARYAVDPDDPLNSDITDLHLADTNEVGHVCFDGDITLLLPETTDNGNGTLLLEAPNRGHPLALRSFNRAPFDVIPSDAIEPGDGFLMRHGWSIAFVGWQWDVPTCTHRLGLRPPMVRTEYLDPKDEMQLRIQPDSLTYTFDLTDQHVGAVGNHRPIPPARPDDPKARLLVRDHLWGEPELIERSRWHFHPAEDRGEATRFSLDNGFQPGQLYDLIYAPAECPVVGAGLLAIRDFGSFARYAEQAPTAGTISHTIAHGISQCGRLLRSMIHLGLNTDETGRQVFDGVLPHIAGARRGEFNQRYGQPSVQPTPSFGHLFPFADEPQTDPRTGQAAGLLDSLKKRNAVPKIMYTETSSEYWRGDASLTHFSVETGQDVEPPPEVRRYLFASTQHGPGIVPFTNQSMFGSHGANWFNVIDYRPLFRALLTHLRAWIVEQVDPPPSAFPRLSDRTAQSRTEVLDSFLGVPIQLPDPERLPVLYPLNLGSLSNQNNAQLPAERTGERYPSLVSTINIDGNELAGIPMPDVSVPVATHTGFDPRHSETGGNGQILEYLGSSVPFAVNTVDQDKDSRRTLRARYSGREAYLEAVRQAADTLVSQRYLLDEDVELCVEIAAERYDAVFRSEAISKNTK